MNGFNLISSKQLIGEMYSDFNITNDDWVNKAQRFMSRALGLMKVDGYYEVAYHMATVENFNAVLPCDSKNVITVLSSISGVITRLPLTKSLALGADFSNIADDSIYKATINYNALRTNFKEGIVMFIYYRIPKDVDGDLLIPDNDDVLEAIPFYLIYRMSLSGYKHPVISMDKADSKWKELYPRARNSMNYPSIEEIHRMSKMLNNPLFGDIIDEEWRVDSDLVTVAISSFVDQFSTIPLDSIFSTNVWEEATW